MRIHSIIDVTTNSSSETFIGLYESASETVKELINKVLRLSASGFTFDDFFRVEKYILCENYDTGEDVVVIIGSPEHQEYERNGYGDMYVYMDENDKPIIYTRIVCVMDPTVTFNVIDMVLRMAYVNERDC